MAIPPWTVELIRRGLSDVAKKAREPESIEKWKSQAGEILQEIPKTAARSLDSVMRSAEAGKKSVQRWARRHTAIATPMLNASGVLLSETGSGLPPSSAIVEIAGEMVGGDHVGGRDWNGRMSARMRRCLKTPEEHSILVAHRFEAAMAAIGLLVNDSCPLVIHRSQAARMQDGKPLPNYLSDLTGKRIVEVGGADDADANDFAGMESFVTVCVDRGMAPVHPFVMKTEAANAIQVGVLPVGTIIDLSLESSAAIPSTASLLASGFDLAIVRGDGVAGGPPSGVIVGSADVIQAIATHAAWPSLAASDATLAMTLVGMEASRAGEPSAAEQRIETSLENLNGRAERLATRLKGNDAIVACEVTSATAKITSAGRWSFPSRQLRLRHIAKSAADWKSELAGDDPALIAMVDNGDLVIDLRWIAPSDDAKLAESLGDKPVSPSS